MKAPSKPLLTLAVLIWSICYSRAQECTCAETFEQVVQVYEQDYALFTIKVTEANRAL